MERLRTIPVRIGDSLIIGGNAPIAVQTMCDTHTSDVEATTAQCLRLAAAGAQLIRITVPGLNDVAHVREIRRRLRESGCNVPLAADIHFSSETAIAVASEVEKVRINPGNFHADHDKARARFSRLIEVCRDNGTAIRIGLNHGSLGRFADGLIGPLLGAVSAGRCGGRNIDLQQNLLPLCQCCKSRGKMVLSVNSIAQLRPKGIRIFGADFGPERGRTIQPFRGKNCIVP